MVLGCFGVCYTRNIVGDYNGKMLVLLIKDVGAPLGFYIPL